MEGEDQQEDSQSIASLREVCSFFSRTTLVYNYSSTRHACIYSMRSGVFVTMNAHLGRLLLMQFDVCNSTLSL